MNLIIKISLLVLFISVWENAYSQNAIGVRLNKELLKTKSLNYFSIPAVSILFNSEFHQLKNAAVNNLNQVDLTEIAFDCNDLATFCRLELKLEKAAKFPIKFRLGEVQYVERMEGKY
ncbi:MAG: hypothetical protein R2825_03600 [Saprospiraceae bacterium]